MSKKSRRVNKQKRASPTGEQSPKVPYKPTEQKQERHINKQARKISARTSTIEVGQPGIVNGSYFIQDSRKTELAMPRRLCTFDVMAQDDSVSNSINFTNMLVVNALYGGKFIPGSSGSNRSQIAADALNYMIHNMSYGTWLDFCINASTDLKYGFSFANLVTERYKRGKYKGSIGIKKLSPRCQKTVYGWVWDNKMREFEGFVQVKNLKQRKMASNKFLGNINLLNASKQYEYGYPYLKREQLLHFTYNSTNNNPQGNSPLMDCYNAWAEKKLIEKFEISAITKGLGGVLLLTVPSALLEKANDPRFPEATAEYIALQTDAAAIHSAENALMVLPSDVDEITKQSLYGVKFMGVEGGTSTNAFDTSKIIDQKRKAIYNTFLTSAILLGQGDTGSYALSTNITSMHGLAVENNILQKTNVLNTQLVPRMLGVNDIDLDWEDMPTFEPISPNEADADSLSKVVQRFKSVGAMTPKALETVYTELGWDISGIEDLVFLDGDTSRGGEGEGTSGTGGSQDTGGGSTSTANVENADTQKSQEIKYFVRDGSALTDAKTGLYVGEIDE